MEEWKEYKLGDILNFRRGHDLPKSEMRTGDIPVAGSNGIIGYHDTATPVAPCITIGRSGNVGTPYIYDKCWAHNTVLYVDDFKGNNPLYLFYLLKTLPLSSFGGGSAVPTLNRNHIHPLLVRHTSDLKLQKRIATLLKSLDDKIDVNKRINDNLITLILVSSLVILWLLKLINDNLEQQAQALFKSWFVDYEPFKDVEFEESELGLIPSGWTVDKLGEVCSCILGGTPSRNNPEYWNGNIAWINSGEVNRFRITKPSENITEEGLRHSATKLLPKKTTVLAITGATLGQVSLLEIDSCANQSVIGVLENKKFPYSFIYPLIKERIKDLMSHMTGGAQQHINKNNVEELSIIHPPQKIMESFKNIITPLYEKIGFLCLESNRLELIRDMLLPKLMSGEVVLEDVIV